MRCAPLLTLILLIAHSFIVHAEDADESREKGIAALKDSQTNPHAIVEAARHFVKAAALYGDAGNEEKNVEMNSFLYWCKKKMTLEDIEQFTKGGEAAVTSKLAAVEKAAPKADEAQKWFDRADQFAQKNPTEHLLIAIRFFEVADRFKGSDSGVVALDRSLKELLQEKSSAVKSALPPTAVSTPKVAPTTGGSQAIPPADKIKEAEKVIKDLFKAEYAKTDASSRLALAAKLLQQADENKNDAASEYVLLRKARELAVGSGDVANSTKANKRLRDSFSLDFAGIFADLKLLEATVRTPEAAAPMAALFSSAAEDALEADNFEQAVRFSSHTDELLPLVKDTAMKSRLKTATMYAQTLKRDSSPALAAIKILATKPDDPDANLIAGKFALERGKFGVSFTLLAKGKDVVISSVAKRELAPPTEAAEQLLLADGWFDSAEKEPNNYVKARMKERAAIWYENALPALTGLAKVKAKARFKTLLPESNAPHDPIFLSELTPEVLPTGYGGLGRGKGPGGEDIKVNGKVMRHSLFMCTAGDVFVKYDIGKKYETLTTGYGMNDGVNPANEFQFIVIGDGRVLYDSKAWTVALRPQMKPDMAEVDVTGVQKLTLKITDNGPGLNTHTIWIEPRLK